MSAGSDVIDVKRNIADIYNRRVAAIYALSLEYAAIALRYFRQVQSGGGFWQNRTSEALNRMFSNAFRDGNEIGWFMSHGVSYGVYLELANDRKHEAIRPTIQRFASRFINAVKRLYE
jgi:hypothetical protein